MNKDLLAIIVVSFLGGVLISLSASSIFLKSNSLDLGSIETGQEYNATTTAAMATGFSVLKSTSGSLGSVIVASSSAATFTIWNATSTTDIASTSPVRFVASPANGTYTFDAVFDRGIIVQNPTGSNGSYTVTWR